MNFILTTLIAFSIGFTGSPSQAPSQAPFMGLTEVLQAQRAEAPNHVRCEEDMPCWDCKTMGNLICGPVQAPVEAPVALTTVSAPVEVTAAPKAPAKVTVQAPAPVKAPIKAKAPAKVTVQAPAPVQPATPAVDPYSGNPIVDCAAQGKVRAEDYSCVPATFYAPVKGVTPTAPVAVPPHAEPAPTQAPVRGKLCVDKLTISGPPAPNECVSR
jgi:hypothetical protein